MQKFALFYILPKPTEFMLARNVGITKNFLDEVIIRHTFCPVNLGNYLNLPLLFWYIPQKAIDKTFHFVFDTKVLMWLHRHSAKK